MSFRERIVEMICLLQ